MDIDTQMVVVQSKMPRETQGLLNPMIRRMTCKNLLSFAQAASTAVAR